MTASSRADACRWAWRTFAKPPTRLAALMPLDHPVSNHGDILCDLSDTRVTIHEHGIDVKVRDRIEDGLEPIGSDSHSGNTSRHQEEVRTDCLRDGTFCARSR